MTDYDEERWWKISGSNLQAKYGYGTQEDAEEYADMLNRQGYGPGWEASEADDYDEDKRNDGLTLAEEISPDEIDYDAGPIDSSPGYRASMQDAGRGRLLGW
jgi:hypothetical protein